MHGLARFFFQMNAVNADSGAFRRPAQTPRTPSAQRARRLASLGTPWASRDKSSVCGRSGLIGAMLQLRARPALIAYATAWRFSTGSFPGSPRQTGHTCVLGVPPNAVLQPHQTFASVSSSAWISSPITIRTRWSPSSSLQRPSTSTSLPARHARPAPWATRAARTCTRPAAPPRRRRPGR